MQAVERAVGNAQKVQMPDRVGEIIAVVPALADPLADQPDHFVHMKAAGILPVRSVDGEGMARQSLAAAARVYQTRPIHAQDHLAVPQIGQRLAGPCAGHAIGDAAARAAAVEPEYEAGPVGGAAVAVRIHTERSVPAVQQRRARVGMSEPRIPHQRAVGEDPDVRFDGDRIEESPLAARQIVRESTFGHGGGR